MLLDGKIVRDKILDDIQFKLKKINKTLTLSVIEIGNNYSNNVYLKQKEKMCNYMGFNFNHIKLSENVLEEDVIKIIEELNNNDNVDGIMLQLPIPNHIDKEYVINKIDYTKDVDGLTNINQERLINNNSYLVPCTSLGIIKLLEYYNINYLDKNIVILGSSKLVGIPLYNILKNKNVKVTICNSKSDYKKYTKVADIVICAIGKAKYIKYDDLKEGAIVIDVGINRLDNDICGDVDFDDVKDKVSYITPVPGGVGPVTVAMLANNLYDAYIKRNGVNL